MMREKYNPHLRAAILEVVHNQLANKTPPETSQTFERLLREGKSEDEAKMLIASVVSVEIFEVLKRQEPYNNERFVKALNSLPELPEG
jgi:hypothetical protein